ncbi:hypothetical protein Glove_117g577 [Diversispora epigaea]|uniref:Uncharacterized protein n=1 Tax=Diversispora epigaea TaxID=1348612 RepID=A0A397J345_9GLOM|nr:hypothetical protein Glove_117g577 [Diversispora epigaea]
MYTFSNIQLSRWLECQITSKGHSHPTGLESLECQGLQRVSKPNKKQHYLLFYVYRTVLAMVSHNTIYFFRKFPIHIRLGIPKYSIPFVIFMQFFFSEIGWKKYLLKCAMSNKAKRKIFREFKNLKVALL